MWTTCIQETKKEIIHAFKISPKRYDLSTYLVQLPDTRYSLLYLFIHEKSTCHGWTKQTCLKYRIKNSKWNCIKDLNNARSSAACKVFEGKIVVSGGILDNWNDLKSVEAYDHHENKWNYLPDMIYERQRHGAVSMGNKMFVIGGFNTTSCEVFDSISREFTATKRIEVVGRDLLSAVGIGNKILAFPKLDRCAIKSVQVYDVLKDQWFEKAIDLSEVKYVISCSKLPVV